MGFFGTLIASWLGCKLVSPTKYIYDNIHVNTVLEQKPDEPEDKTITVGENGTKVITDL